MQKSKKNGVGHNKQFGPIQKLTVPDFQHISNQYDKMQNELLDQPTKKKKQMKPFSIRKIPNPNQLKSVQQNQGFVQSDNQLGQANGISEQGQAQMHQRAQEQSLLTTEEQEALKPKEVTVENPWIYEQTHKEYLDNIKGLPARHANVIKKHHDVQKETTFLQKVEAGIDKDQATKEAIALLDKEYEIFNDPNNMPGVKVLTRYDTWDEDRTVEDWVEHCQARAGQAHALSPVYQGYEYCWKPVEVLSFDYKEKKYKVKVVATGQEKLVTRLSLLFFDEDPDKFKERVNQCKQRQEIVEAELRFTNLVDSVPTDSVSTLSKERRFYFLSKSVRESDKFDPDKIYSTFKHLLRVVEEEYIRQMKKCVILKEMEDPQNFQKFARMKIPIRLSKKTYPYFGVVRCAKYSFSYNYNEIQNQHFSSDEDLVAMTRVFIQKSIDFQQQRFMQTNKHILKLPRELADLQKAQASHHAAVAQNMMIQWRDFLIGEIQDKLRKNHHFFENDNEKYESSALKRIITRFEYILNTYLREFVKLSIEDWVSFIQHFTNPNLNNDELWKVNETPCVIIHFSIKRPEKKKGKAKKEEKAKVDSEKQPENADEAQGGDDEDDKKKIIYKPSIDECREFILSSMKMIIQSTNKVNSLERDLMPFLEKDEKSNFKIDETNQWIQDAIKNLNKLISENLSGPNELLERYKKFEYVLHQNSNVQDLIKDLFQGGENGEKKSLEEIREQALHYEKTYYDIMTCSEDEVDFRIFRVMSKKLKESLAKAAENIKMEILNATYKFCTDTVTAVNANYKDMQDKITHDPENEKELKFAKEFNQIVMSKVEENVETLKMVQKHLEMLDEFSYTYKEHEIEAFWMMRIWPMKIQDCLKDGKDRVNERNDQFATKLAHEQEIFTKQILQYQHQFEKIKEFKKQQYHEQLQEFNNISYNLDTNINNAKEKIMEFHEREVLFGNPETPYPDLDDLDKQFRPFCSLINIAYEVKNSINDWTTEKIMNISDPGKIGQNIQSWTSDCFKLQKKLADDYPDTSEVAIELRKKITEFSKNLPLIEAFTSEAVDIEDWKEICEVVGKPDMEREEIRVSNFGELNLYEYIGEINDISSKALKKFNLQKSLKEMKDEMKGKTIEQKAHKGTFLVKGWDDINGALDDQTVKTQAMLGSSNIGKGKLKADTKKWVETLLNLSDLMDQMLKTQRSWMQLEPIFSSGDIATTMPLEAKMFNEVDALWKNTMKAIEEDSALIELAPENNAEIQPMFVSANVKLEKIQKSLSDYLEQKRLIFARFFFLANEDLLQILAQTKNPLLIQAHIDKCFEGISKLQFNEAGIEIGGMKSAEGEIVDYLKQINVEEGDRKGNVEKWMLDVEAQMMGSLKDLAKRALAEYPRIQRTEWSKMWPGQIVLAVSQIYWTEEVEQAIKDHENGGLENYYNILQQQIEDIVQMVRTDLKPMERITIKALVVIDVHARDVVGRLRDMNIQQKDDFEWSSQLRYYWEQKDQLQVKMVTADIAYGYEYLGNSPRLVITPLTDRCYRTLLGAKYLNYGGAPEGPAGTGKTESVKDLAKAIAVYCVVFNCSDGLDYLAMAKFFKGLAQSGAWCCFDEFNRIDLEVLSVIAQQIQCIQNAIKNPKTKVFEFESTNLTLNRGCNVNITMNPGYAGRSELPDNLKALFRPCAMMVPDYALIAQIELYSFGFSDALPLSVKVVASLRLSSELLSSQFHYDFGMRAVKSILTACGNSRRILSDWDEDKICLKALNDVNVPKFTSNDILLYKGITTDLFPGVQLPQQDYSTLIEQMKQSCIRQNIQSTEYFISKCIQLYETIMVRHGLMVVGQPYCGKSCVMKTLQQAMSNIKNDPNFVNVLTYYVNPKSITQNQLYGVFDMDSQEWSDGVLAIKIRDCAESESPDRKWVCFDGPVDAVWIENMNTVLDDNKKLCLNSGQIIKLKPTMTIMFQVDDLSQASPATVSRCGMVLLESEQLGHSVYVTSYMNDLRSFIDPKIIEKFEKTFHYLVDTSVEFTRKNGKFPCPGTGPFVVNHMIKLIECNIRGFRPSQDIDDDEDEEAESKIPPDIEDRLYNTLIYAAIWGIGACLNETSRPAFDLFFQDLINGEDVITKNNLDIAEAYEPIKIPNKIGEFKSLFDIFYDQEEMRWTHWLSTQPKYQVNREDTYLMLSIPTMDQIRMNHICKTLLHNGMHCLFVGPTGTGKSVSVIKMLKQEFENDEWVYFSLGFSAQTSANQTERIIDGKMEKQRKGVYGPKGSKQGVIFVDDLNMPQKEKYGAQPPIELLRQWMDYQGWYDIDDPERQFKKITNVRFCGAMGPPGDGRNSISSRYIRHFNVIYVEPFSDESLKYIFQTVMDWFFAAKNTPPFPAPVQALKEQLVANTILIYNETQKAFRPTPAKAHYSYNLRDVSKVFQGIAQSTAKTINTEDLMIKLWAHECARVFQDRLISIEDRDKFQEILVQIMKDKFKREWKSIVKHEPLLFASFVPLVPVAPDSNKLLTGVYCELTDKEKVRKTAEESLGEFNNANSSKKMNLVLFEAAIEHVVKISRIISTEFGHALLIGVGGSGRKSLTQLSVFINLMELYQIEISKSYDILAWKDNMREDLFMNCGVGATPTVFLLSDTQIINEAFLEDVNNILNNGEIPNLYGTNEEQSNLVDNMREEDKKFKDYGDNEIMAEFYVRCKQNIHVVLAMSPIGDDYKRRLRMFPSLVNCCAIDWFLPWPKEALVSVAEQFVKDIDDLPSVEGVVQICVDMQLRTTSLSEKYKEREKRFYYVTPTSYLVLIQAFKDLLEKKRIEIFSLITKYDTGIKQLANANKEVDILKGKLIELMPKLQVAQKETEELIVDVDKQKKDVAIKTKEVEAEEAFAKEKKGEAEAIQRDCEFELSKVMPIYNAAIRAVQQLKKDDITELRGFKTVAPAVILVAKTLCIMFGVKAVMEGQGKNKTENWWASAKDKLLKPDLLHRCTNFERDNIDPKIIEILTPIVHSDEYSYDNVKKSSLAAAGLGKWVKAMIQYDEAMKIVRPKQAQLKEAKEKAQAAQQQWDTALAALKEIQDTMAKLVAQFDEAKAREKALQDQYEDSEKKCNRAVSLIDKLSDEEVSWAQSLEVNRSKMTCIVGDIIIASGIIAYLGVFSEEYRAEAIDNWIGLMKSFDIKSSAEFKLQNVLGIPTKIQQWKIDNLPDEDFAVDNGIIMDNSDRWPLMLDPQMQGNIWVKTMEKQDLKSIKPTMDAKQMSRALEQCIPYGHPIILEDATEEFDPLVEPLLAKQIDKKGNMWTLKLGDTPIEYSKDFRFYVTTKLPRPHYSPEVCVKVTMLNFMVTEKGLTDQMLNIVVKHEDPKNMDKFNQAIVTSAANNKKKAELEDKILNQIAQSDVDILEDDVLLITLDESKAQCKQIEAQMKQDEMIMKIIDGVKENFLGVANRVARLFFVLIQIMQVDPMYQYSLKFFKTIYSRALDNGNDIPTKPKNLRKDFFIKEFTRLLYENICRSLFENHKLLFSFLICLKIMYEKKEPDQVLDPKEVRFIMTGGTSVDMPKPNPTGEQGWITDKMWASIIQISSEFEAFRGLDDNIAANLDQWEIVYNSQNPQSKKTKWPAPYDDLSLIKKAMFLRIFRSDKVIQVIQKLVKKEKELGPSFIVPPPFDMAKSYADSLNSIPIIIVLSPGADPMGELLKLAAQENQRVIAVSLGQGQGEIAKNKIKEAIENQIWVCLQNCHLSPSFMPSLDAIIENIEENKSSKFRMWLTSMPSDKFPVTILQNGVKAVIEPPKGLKNNILRSYLGMDKEEFESCEKPAAFKALMWGLCFFNALILERRKFGPLGWNIPYEFSNSDLAISQAQLMMFLNHFEVIPYDALRYMVAEANYGGRVTDPNDRVCINIILEDFYNPAMLKPQHKLVESGKYFVPPEGDLQSYQDFIRNNLPLNDLTEVFGLHDNAEITSAIQTTNKLLATALALQGSTASSASGQSQDDIIREISTDILSKIPKNFDTEEAAKKHPIKYEESLNTVLAQELLRFNALTSTVRSSLINVGKAIKGEVPLSLELEEVSNSLFNNSVPDVWHKRAYPSLKPLASWIQDFLARLKFIQDWIDNGAPPVFWISGFYFTQSFLTGAKQNYARKYVIAIDTIDFNFKVISDETKFDLEKGPDDGVYVNGLFVEGCRWDEKKEALEESMPKVLFTQMKTIWVIPQKKDDIDYGHSYKCPVYKTARRAGTLSTTGHSTNFVLYIWLPIQKKHKERHWVKKGVAMLTGLSD